MPARSDDPDLPANLVAAVDDDGDDLLTPDPGVGAAIGPATPITIMVGGEHAGGRLDRVLTEILAASPDAAHLSRSRLKSLIEEGAVTWAGVTIVDASHRVKGAGQVTITVPDAVPAIPIPQAIPLSIIYEDEHLLVIDKDAGMVVHPAAGNHDGTLVNALLHHCGDRLSGIGGVRRPGIVHRLDKDTSGLMVVAKTDAAHQGLSAQFSDRTLSRTYHAVTWGIPTPREGEVVGAIGRHPTDRKRMAVVTKGGKPAHTLYRVVKPLGMGAALVECRLLTGRTHQIRVHMTEIGHPLMGDPLYGRVRPGRASTLVPAARETAVSFPRQALHAVGLRFRHPVTGTTLAFESALPADIGDLIQRLGALY